MPGVAHQIPQSRFEDHSYNETIIAPPTAENVAAIHDFRPMSNETPERMFASVNLLAKALEDDRPSTLV